MRTNSSKPNSVVCFNLFTFWGYSFKGWKAKHLKNTVYVFRLYNAKHASAELGQTGTNEFTQERITRFSIVFASLTLTSLFRQSTACLSLPLLLSELSADTHKLGFGVWKCCAPSSYIYQTVICSILGVVCLGSVLLQSVQSPTISSGSRTRGCSCGRCHCFSSRNNIQVYQSVCRSGKMFAKILERLVHGILALLCN